MKIGTMVHLKAATDILAQFEALKQSGFDNCQLTGWDPHLWTAAEAARINQAKERFGIDITAFWCGWSGPRVWDFVEGPLTLGLVPAAYRFQRAEELVAGAAFAALLGVGDVVTHAGFIPENPSDPDYAGLLSSLRYISRQLDKNGQRFLFETGQETPVTLLRTIQDTGAGNLYINLDPANLIMYGKANPVDAMRVFGRYVRGVHAKDGLYPTDGRSLGKETPLGEGLVDFVALLNMLKQAGYDGALTIEREISGPQQRNDIAKASDLLRSILARL